MTDKERARKAYDKVLVAIFYKDPNPTYELCKVTLENLTSKAEVFLMEEYRFFLLRRVRQNRVVISVKALFSADKGTRAFSVHGYYSISAPHKRGGICSIEEY